MIMNKVYTYFKKLIVRGVKDYPPAKSRYENLWMFCEEEINDHDKWAKIYFTLILAITITLFFLHKNSCQDLNSLTFKYTDDYLTMLPVIIFDILCASKFLKHTKLIDHYAHKKFIVVAMENIKIECNSDDKESYMLKLYDKLLEQPIINDNQAIKVKLDKIMLKIGNIKDKDK